MEQWAEEITSGLGGWWTCYQFDRAVLWFGNFVENKLNERDERTHRPIYDLEYLIGDPQGLSDFKKQMPHMVEFAQ